jgi:hypothetical protein
MFTKLTTCQQYEYSMYEDIQLLDGYVVSNVTSGTWLAPGLSEVGHLGQEFWSLSYLPPVLRWDWYSTGQYTSYTHYTVHTYTGEYSSCIHLLLLQGLYSVGQNTSYTFCTVQRSTAHLSSTCAVRGLYSTGQYTQYCTIQHSKG